nr:hypothetical protein [Tanacetum cinerariifolium]
MLKLLKNLIISLCPARACSIAYYCADNESAPELDQAKGTGEADLVDLCAEIEDSLERDGGVSMRAVSASRPRLSKSLDAPPSIAVVTASEQSHVGTPTPASTSSRSLSLGGMLLFPPLFIFS